MENTTLHGDLRITGTVYWTASHYGNSVFAGENLTGAGTIKLRGYSTIHSASKASTVVIDESENNVNYQLPVASATQLGGVKAGSNVTIAPDGTLLVAGGGFVTNWLAGEQLVNSLVQYGAKGYLVTTYRANGTGPPGPTTTSTYTLWIDPTVPARTKAIEDYPEHRFNEQQFAASEPDESNVREISYIGNAPAPTVEQVFALLTPGPGISLTQVAGKIRISLSGTIPDEPSAPAAPSTLTVTREAHATIEGEFQWRVTWNEVAGAASYDSNINNSGQVENTTGTTRFLYALAANTNYEANVWSVNEIGVSEYLTLSFNSDTGGSVAPASATFLSVIPA